MEQSKYGVGFIGLGKMGGRLAKRLAENGRFTVIGYDIDKTAMQYAAKNGIICATSLEDTVRKLEPRRVLFMMVPGSGVDAVLNAIAGKLSAKDIIVDAGNSFYQDSFRRANKLLMQGIYFLDAGTSGGLEAGERGASFMVAGNYEAFKFAKPVFESMAWKFGVWYFGKSGNGHFVKMVHNAIEYALLEAYAEGIDLVEKKGLNPLTAVTAWQNGGLIRSYLLQLFRNVIVKNPNLNGFTGKIGGGETGSWGIEEANKRGVMFDVIEKAYEKRIESSEVQTYASKLISAVREEFGGHEEQK